MPVAAAIGISGVVGAGANYIAGQTQAASASRAADMQQKQYQQTRTDLQPFVSAGANGTNMLMSRLPSLTAPITLDQSFLESTPGFQFALSQGLKSVQSSAAARGLGTSGAALKGAASYATGLADQTYQNQFANELAQRNQAFNQLLGTSQLGANAAAQSGQIGQAGAASAGNSLITGGTAQAAGLTGAANALTNAGNSYAGYQYAQQNPYANGNPFYRAA